ncbi:MAG TPA: APC family permease [Gemmatimonadaceae bacterium]
MTAESPAPAQASLSRKLSLRDLVVYGLLFIGPLAPVGVFGVLDAHADGAVALVYLLATIAMGFTAWSYAQMSRVVPHAGSVFAYASRGVSRSAGFVAGWMAMLDYLLIPSVAYLFSGIALHAMVPSVGAWVFTVAAFALTTALNLLGVRVAARVGFLVLVAEIVALALFIVAGGVVLWTHGPAGAWTAPFVGVGPLNTGMVTAAISIAVLSFLGFDAIASFAEESTGDARQVGRAIMFCLVLAGVLFVVQSYLASVLSVIPPSELAAHPERQGTAFYDIARLAVGPWMATLLALTKATGPAFSAMTGQAAAGRLLFGMARDGQLPRALARVDARHGVPRASLLTVAALTLAVSVWAARQPDGLSVLVGIVDVGALAAFTLLHASVVGYFVVRRNAPARAAHRVLPVAGAAITLWVLVGSSTAARTVGAVWLGVGVAVFVAGRHIARRDSRRGRER